MRPGALQIVLDEKTAWEVRRMAEDLGIEPAEVIQRAFRLFREVARHDEVQLVLDGRPRRVKVR